MATSLACAAILSTTFQASAQFAQADDLHDRQSQVKRKITSAQGDVEDASLAAVRAAHRLRAAQATLDAAQAKLAGTQRDLAAANALDAQMQARLAAAEQALLAAQAAVAQARAQVEAQRVAIGRMAARNYQDGDPRVLGLSVMLNSQRPEDVTIQMNTVSSVMNLQTRELGRLRDAEAQMAAEEVAVDLARQQVETQRQQAAANLVRSQQLEQSAREQTAAVAGLVGQRATARAIAEQAKAADLAKLRQLRAEESKIQSLILEAARKRAAAAAASAGSAPSASYNGETGGLLYRPASGGVTSPFGYRTHPIYGYYGLHDGTDFSAACGSALYAAGSGRVISTYYSSVWGNRLIVDLGTVNGKNLTAIYNHLSSYSVGTGDRVKRGQVVGRAGSTGWSTGCHLHFTVMVNGQAVNPLDYT